MLYADPIFLAKKNQVLAAVKSKDCPDYQWVKNNFNGFVDIPKVLQEFSKTFDCDPAYLEMLAAIFTAAEMNAVGVYYNETSGTLTNPKFLIKCTGVNVVINAGGSFAQLDIADESDVSSILISNNTQLNVLNIGGGSIVDNLKTTGGSVINILLVKSCESTYLSQLKNVAAGSRIVNVGVDPGATYGGIACG